MEGDMREGDKRDEEREISKEDEGRGMIEGGLSTVRG
jgi:hypothetical protein